MRIPTGALLATFGVLGLTAYGCVVTPPPTSGDPGDPGSSGGTWTSGGGSSSSSGGSTSSSGGSTSGSGTSSGGDDGGTSDDGSTGDAGESDAGEPDAGSGSDSGDGGGDPTVGTLVNLCGKPCAAGEELVGNACVVKPVADGCPVNQRKCAGTCVNVHSDPKNCGDCGNVCGAGDVCVAQQCAPLTSFVVPWLTSIGTHITTGFDLDAMYRVLNGDIVRTDKETGATTVLVPGPITLTSLRVDSRHVYWSTTSDGMTTVHRVRKDGSLPPEEAMLASPTSGRAYVDIDDNNVWVVHNSGVRKTSKVPGGPVETASSGVPPLSIYVGADAAFFYYLVDYDHVGRMQKSIAGGTAAFSQLTYTGLHAVIAPPYSRVVTSPLSSPDDDDGWTLATDRSCTIRSARNDVMGYNFKAPSTSTRVTVAVLDDKYIYFRLSNAPSTVYRIPKW